VLDDPTVPEDNPEADVGIDIPEVDVPAVDTTGVDTAEGAENTVGVSVPDESDVPAELRASFWSVVLIFNVAVFLLGVGPMFALIAGRWRLGGGLFTVGVVAFVFGIRRVRIVKNGFD
jgi:hypothetical protein